MNRIVVSAILIMALFTACGNVNKRETVSLNGIWQIAEGTMNKIPDSFDHTVQVPGLVSLATPSFRDVGPRVKDRRSLIQKDTLREAFWYSRTFDVTKVPEVAILKVSKAMFGTKVFVNGKDTGEHLPCFTTGYFNIKDALKPGENKLLIRIGSCRNSVPFSIPDGFDFEKERYIPGIFDNVELILSGVPNIVSIQTAPDIARKQVHVQVKLANRGNISSTKLNFIVREAVSGRIAGRLSRNVRFAGGTDADKVADVNIPVKNCRFWSPEDPFLYDLTVSTDGDMCDTRFGMREFRYDPERGMTLLNGKPYFMKGSNITLYRFFEDAECGDLPWNHDWVRRLHRSFKQFHWNGLRYCIGIAPEEWYRIADEEGILIQNEFPIWYGGQGWCVWPEELKTEELAREYSEWMQEQWNHPSVVIWDASNETVSNDGKTEEIANAINIVRKLDLSNRPWDNSYSEIRSPGDVMELHPYHFQDPSFSLKKIANADINPGGKPDEKRYMKIVNEYGWLWLNRDGSPTTLTAELYKNLLGAGSSEARRRHLYATWLAAETEFWRCHRKCSAVLHFTALAYSRPDGQTSDHFTDVRNLVYDPEFLKYIPDAFSPVGLMLDEWGNEIRSGVSHDYKIIAINDLEQEWNGKVYLRIYDGDNLITESSSDIVIPAFGQTPVKMNLALPKGTGTFTVVASLERENERPVKSLREIPFI
ncbi:MAG: glycoside hydrolase family 2 TIM barrel-domain containing protein [Bacteroidota bacterium]|nr:glycoside hydrolase family 2 TIM barrel-domain containing protein [Bacteroidota bacterium]